MRNPAYDKIAAHWNHKVQVSLYGPEGETVSAAVECVDCNEVLMSEDKETEDEEWQSWNCMKGND